MRKYVLRSWDALDDVFIRGRYCDEALSARGADDMTTRIVYGVLENNLKIERILEAVMQRKTQKSVFTLLKIGVYSLIWLDNVPDYAVVSECVEAMKSRGKGGAAGFVNAVLKKVARGEYTLDVRGKKEELSASSNLPMWFLCGLEEDFGEEVMLKVAHAKKDLREHIRVNTRLTNVQEVVEILRKDGEEIELTVEGGIAASVSERVKELFGKGYVSFQSPSSMLAVNTMGLFDGAKVLDLCAAPGGKTAYIAELVGKGSVTACELYPFRLRQLEGYLRRMRADNVTTVQADATIFNAAYEGKFDFVLVDAPCSCTGTFLKHPDVFFNRAEGDIPAINSIQVAILKNAARYVKRDGKLLYSTCSLIASENDGAVERLFEECKDARAEDVDLKCGAETIKTKYGVQILPGGLYDGFYISKIDLQ